MNNDSFRQDDYDMCSHYNYHNNFSLFMPRLGGAYCFRRVRSQRKSVDWGTMGPALGGAYECYAHISSYLFYELATSNISVLNRKCFSMEKFVRVSKFIKNTKWFSLWGR